MSRADDRPIRSIAVAGGGIVGQSAAIAFARALPRAVVTLIETSRDLAALADRMPTAWPSTARFHGQLGIDEVTLVRSGVATHHLGTRFEDWPPGRPQWTHAFGGYGRPASGIPFDQIWARARTREAVGAFDSFSPAAVFGNAGKFVHPLPDPASPLADMVYGLRLDPEEYRAALATVAGPRVRRAGGDIASITLRADGGVAQVRLTGGTSIDADLYIDCTGPRAQIVSAIDDSFEDWSRHLPADRLLIASAPSAEVAGPLATVKAVGIGWIGEWPLLKRSLRALACHSSIDAQDARNALGCEDSEWIAVRAGRRPRPWVHNVLALGDAAVMVDPLHGLNLDLAQRGILLALELLPGRDCHPLELAEYNRRFGLIAGQSRDFLAAHYYRSGRSDSDFWRRAAQAPPPETLARILDQYEYRARLPFLEEETLSRESWTAALLGLGVIPRAAAPRAAEVPIGEAVAAMHRLSRQIENLAENAPSYPDYLERMIGPRPSPSEGPS